MSRANVIYYVKHISTYFTDTGKQEKTDTQTRPYIFVIIQNVLNILMYRMYYLEKNYIFNTYQNIFTTTLIDNYF